MTEPRVLNAVEASKWREQQERDRAAAKAKQAEVGVELDGKRWQRFVAKVRRERQARIEQREADDAIVAAMNPIQLNEYLSRQRQQPPRREPLPKGWVIALQDAATEDAKARNREREQREADAGLPTLQARYDERVQEIRDARALAVADAAERHRTTVAEALETEREQLAELGERPSLEARAA